MIELGGNIKLDGFSELNPADLLIVKKLVGNHVKNICDLREDFKEITVTLKSSKQKAFELETFLSLDKPLRSNASGSNLFFAVDQALKNLHSQFK